jgi:hypothetical protein
VTFADGTVQHLIPVRANGAAFVGAYFPPGGTVASARPVTGPNK